MLPINMGILPDEASQLISWTPLQVFTLSRLFYRTFLTSQHLVVDTEEYLKNLGLIKLFEQNPLYLTGTHIILAAQRIFHWKKNYDNFSTANAKIFFYSWRFTKLSRDEPVADQIHRFAVPYIFYLGSVGRLAYSTFQLVDILDFTRDEIGAEISFNIKSLRDDWQSIRPWLDQFGDNNPLKPFINEVTRRLFSFELLNREDPPIRRPVISTLPDAPWKQLMRSAKIEALSKLRRPCKARI